MVEKPNSEQNVQACDPPQWADTRNGCQTSIPRLTTQNYTPFRGLGVFDYLCGLYGLKKNSGISHIRL